MKNYFSFVCFLFLAIFTAYTPRPAATPTQAETVTPIASVTAPATSTPIHSIIKPAPTSTPNGNELVEQCIPVEEKLPDDLGLSGVWVTNWAMPYLQNLDEHTVYSVPLKGGGLFSTENGDIAISPDGTHMAYIDVYLDPIYHRTQNRILRVIRSSGHALDMSFWLENWQWLIGWVDDQNLAILTAKKEIVILNPITGNWHKFQQAAGLGLEDKDHPFYSYSYQPPYLYSPTLTWVLERRGYDTLILKNTQTSQTVWHAKGDEATWSADGTTLAVVSKDSMIVLNNGRQKLRLDANTLRYTYISNLKLSPNGQKLVFTGSSSRPAILDIVQRKFARFCADRFESNWWSNSSWSPDGRFIVQGINIRDPEYTYQYNAADLLIDTQEMRAYLLNSGNYQHRIAWLGKP